MGKYGDNQNKANRPPDQIFRITKEWKVASVLVLILAIGLMGIINLKKFSCPVDSEVTF